MGDDQRRTATGAAGRADEGIAPGALSALLREIVRAPADEAGGRWDHALRAGEVVGRFELVREIGRGGFGVVYEARDRELGRSVAFKAVHAAAGGAVREERLVLEAEAAARLSHPNIVTLHDVGRCELGPYLILELLRGETLAERLERGPIPLREAVQIAIDVARGLAHAHAHAVVHRDLTPGNVFLCDDGQVKVLDFGLAHVFGHRPVHAGTPAYMAPEQWREAPEDERTDVFALGVILHRMITGRLPFPGERGVADVTRAPAPPAVAEAPALAALVARMLALDPVGRPRDGGRVLSELTRVERALDREAAVAEAAPPARGSRRIAWAAAVLAVVLAVLAVLAFVLRDRLDAPSHPSAPGARVTVAVADFENQTGEPELSGLSGMLITSLEQSRHLSILTRARMVDLLRQLGKENVGGVDESLGREVALGASARALVLASIRRFDEVYAIELKVLDPTSNEYLFTLQERGEGKRSVPAMIDRLSRETRERLRESPADVRASSVSVADVTTSSFEAYAHYFRAQQLADAARYREALDAYRRAIAADPTFALAHYQMAYLGEFAGLDAATRIAAMEVAVRNVDRVPAKERLLILAWKAHMERRKDEAHALYARAVGEYPQDKDVLYMAGDLHFHEDRPAEALPFFERALALDPDWEPALTHVMDSLAALGRGEEVMARARSWVERAPTANAYRALARAEILAGHWREAVESARRAFERDGSIWSRARLAEALMLVDRYREAEALVRPATQPSAETIDRAVAIPLLVSALAYQGRRREALEALRGFPEIANTTVPYVEMTTLAAHLLGDFPSEKARPTAVALARVGAPIKGMATMLLLTGEVELAAKEAEKLAPGPDRTIYDALAARRAGDLRRALSLLRSIPDDTGVETLGGALLFRAQIALALGELEEALATLERFQRITATGPPIRAWTYPRTVYLQALAYARLGRRAEARERLAHLSRIWRDADADQPLLAEAASLRRRLATGSGALVP